MQVKFSFYYLLFIGPISVPILMGFLFIWPTPPPSIWMTLRCIMPNVLQESVWYLWCNVAENRTSLTAFNPFQLSIITLNWQTYVKNMHDCMLKRKDPNKDKWFYGAL